MLFNKEDSYLVNVNNVYNIMLTKLKLFNMFIII